MHLLKIDESGALYDSDEAVDLGQPAGEIIFLTSADSEVALLFERAGESASTCRSMPFVDAQRVEIIEELTRGAPL